MSKSLHKILALVLVLVMLVGLAACGTKEETPAPATDTTPAPSTEPEPEPKEVSYTWNTYGSSLANNWNPHTWENSQDRVVLSYLASPFIDYSILDSENGVFQWVYEMATSVEDVTAQHQDDLTKYNVTFAEGKDATNTTEGYVYEFKLNPDAKWENGQKITADDYIYSMQ